MIMLQIGIGVVGFAVNLVLFIAAVWIILPENKNPFDEGFWRAILKAAIFMGCMFVAVLLIAFASALLPYLGLLAAPALFASYCYAWLLFTIRSGLKVSWSSSAGSQFLLRQRGY